MAKSARDVQDLLSRSIDPSSEKFWDAFHEILKVKSERNFDRYGIVNLKLILGQVKNDRRRIQCIAMLLNNAGASLKTEIAVDLSELFLNLTINYKDTNENDIVEFLVALRNRCSSCIQLKNIIFNNTIKYFLHYLEKPHYIPSRILSELFLTQITLITKAPMNDIELRRSITQDHINSCSKLIFQTPDSTVQVAIAEWVWRIKRLLKFPDSSIVAAFKDLAQTFLSITASDFRRSLHAFVLALNRGSSSRVLHFPFSSATIGKTDVRVEGCLDLNADNVAVFFFGGELPDVVLFRIRLLRSEDVLRRQTLVIRTRERNDSFRRIGEAAPTELSFILTERASANDANEFLDRLSKGHTTAVTPLSGRAAKALIPTSKRATAVKPPKPSLKSVKPPENTQESEATVKEVERRLAEFEAAQTAAINSAFDAFANEMRSIEAHLRSQGSALKAIADSHTATTAAATEENGKTAATVRALVQEFEGRHTEARTRRAAIHEAALADIDAERVRHQTDAAAAFTRNAIVDVAQALSRLPGVCA